MRSTSWLLGRSSRRADPGLSVVGAPSGRSRLVQLDLTGMETYERFVSIAICNSVLSPYSIHGSRSISTEHVG